MTVDKTVEEKLNQAVQAWSEYYGVEFSADAGSALSKVVIASAPTIIRDLVERVKLLEDVLRRCESLADNGVDDPAGPYNVLQQVVNTICAVLHTKEST